MVRGEEFDPARSQENFRICLTDNGCTILLPSLVPNLRKTAPGITMTVHGWRPHAYDDVAAGRIDTGLSAEEVPHVLEREVILNLEFVCVVGSAIKLRTRRFTLKQYLQHPHAAVETWTGQQTAVERTLAQHGVKRTFALSLPFFLPAIYAVAHSDLVLTVPRKLVEIAGIMPGIRMIEPPTEIKSFPYFMAWHPRLTSEPAHAWFREQIRLAARRVGKPLV
jgi:DNA-binding transcriptional LysR family regulator